MKSNFFKLTVFFGFFVIISCSNATNSPNYNSLISNSEKTDDKTEDTWTKIETDDISVLKGNWKIENEVFQIMPNKYSYKEIITLVIGGDTDSDSCSVSQTTLLDYSEAVNKYGESLWKNIKDSGELSNHIIDNSNYTATYKYVDSSTYTSIDDYFGDFWYPNSKEYYFNNDKSKFKIYDINSKDSTIYTKQ